MKFILLELFTEASINTMVQSNFVDSASDIHTGNIGYLFDVVGQVSKSLRPPECAMLPPAGDHCPDYVVSYEAWTESPSLGVRQRIQGRYYPLLGDLGNGKQVKKIRNIHILISWP